jgi:response regulator of citrate/malate metabolism
MVWNVKKTIQECADAGILDYTKKRMRFNRDREIIERLLKNKVSLESEHNAGTGNIHKINDLINEIQK